MTDITTDEAVARVKELVEKIDFTMFTSVDDDGTLKSRPMSTRQVDDSGDIWFFTSDDTEKTREVQHDQRVNLAYADPGAMRYVSVSGKAVVIHDRAKMAELYDKTLDIWFEDGLETPGIALFRVVPDSAEFWDPKGTAIGRGFQYLKALVTRSTPDADIMDNRTVDYDTTAP